MVCTSTSQSIDVVQTLPSSSSTTTSTAQRGKPVDEEGARADTSPDVSLRDDRKRRKTSKDVPERSDVATMCIDWLRGKCNRAPCKWKHSPRADFYCPLKRKIVPASESDKFKAWKEEGDKAGRKWRGA